MTVINRGGAGASGGSPAANSPVMGAATLLRGPLVSARSQQPATSGGHASNGTDTGQTTRTAHNLTAPTGYVRLVYLNQQAICGLNGLPVISVILKAGVESPSGNFRPVFFNGQRQVTLDPGGFAVSDPIAVGNLVAGATIYARTFVSTAGGAAASGAWPMTAYTSAAQGEGAVNTATGVAPSDLSTGGAIGASASFGFAPIAVVGAAESGAVKAVAGFGDSIIMGTNDNGPAADYFLWGFLARAINQQYGFINLGFNGDTLASVAQAGSNDQRIQLAAACSNVVLNYGSNDLMINSVATAVTQQNMINAWTLFSNLGCRTFHTTCPPRTSSTDAYATTQNQTPVTSNANAGEAGRQIVNAWLRAGAPIDPAAKTAVAPGTAGALVAAAAGHPLYGVWDVASTVESTQAGVAGAGGNVWQTARVAGDGIHPNNAGHAAFASACNAAQLA